MSERDLHERASEVFLALRGLDGPERERRLDELTSGDAALRAEAASLLAHDVGGADDADETGTPSMIGPYRVIGRLGRGGGGYVLLAEQDEPVRRRVAIKVAPYAAVDPDAAARFEFERRALEQTEHPNIARILDAGRTPEGLPFIVMEYVEGEPITAYCERMALGVRERIGLMLDVAGAAQHAHQRGVIHRDLKPGNILVSGASGKPSVRVLDFGIAKAIASPELSEGAPTSGLPIGTPAYMAPEQTGGRPVDIRADVYALGAVLYELIAGRAPVDTCADPWEAMRRVREDTPPPASSERRHGAPRALLADLDCVLAKALEKNPDRRYPTAASLAEDLGRVLRGEAIVARRPTPGYRAARFVGRNRALVASGVVVALAASVGVAGLAIGLREADAQRREATLQRDAQREINRFLTEDLLAAASADREGQHATALDLLRSASRRVESRLSQRPEIAAAIHHTLGGAYMELGEYDDAQAHFARALELRRAASGPDSPDTVRSEVAVAGLLGARQMYAEAEPALLAAIERARLILGAGDPALYAALNDLGVVYESLDRASAAVGLLREALEGRARLLGAQDPLVLVTTSNLAQAYDRAGDPERSLALMLDALRIAESMPDAPRMTLLGLHNNIGATMQDLRREHDAAPHLRVAADLAYESLGAEHPATLTIRGNLAGLEAKIGNPLRAAELYEEVVKVQASLFGADALSTLTARYGRWNALRLAGRPSEAAAGFGTLLEDMTRALGDPHWLTNQTRVTLARVLLDSGRAGEAMVHAERGLEHFLALYGPEHSRAQTASQLVDEIRVSLSRQ